MGNISKFVKLNIILMKTKQFFLSFIIVLFAINVSFAQSVKTRASISGKSSGNITAAEIIGQTINVSPETYTVQSFTLIASGSESIVNVDITGNVVNKNASNKIRTLPAGTTITFKNIKAKDSGGNFANVPDMVFTLE
jgi:uncharacterized protein YjiK